MPCDQCQVVTINGVACHETGCPNWWKDPITGEALPWVCFECDANFIPEGMPHRHDLCPECLNPDFFEGENLFEEVENEDEGELCEDCQDPNEEAFRDWEMLEDIPLCHGCAKARREGCNAPDDWYIEDE